MDSVRKTDFSAGADGCGPVIGIGAKCVNVSIGKQPPFLAGDFWNVHK